MNPDFLVIGAGVAGMRAAIELAEAGTVLVVAKDSLRESSSEYAQGGIAVALSDDDEVELHEQDTLYAGDGLCDPIAVRPLVEEGPAAIQALPVAPLIARCALARKESRGAHFRTDYPETRAAFALRNQAGAVQWQSSAFRGGTRQGMAHGPRAAPPRSPPAGGGH